MKSKKEIKRYIEELSISAEMALRRSKIAMAHETCTEDCPPGNGVCTRKECDNPACLRRRRR